MNWGEAKSLARTYVHRSDLDFDALQPLVCSNISISLTVQENEVTGNVTLSGPDANGCYSGALPADYALMRAVSQSGRTLNPVDIKMLIERGGMRYAVSGAKFYTISAADCLLNYTAKCLPVSGDGNTNIILSNYPDIYLYGLLKHAAALIQDPDINADFYEQQFLGAVKTANSIYVDAA